MEVIGQAILNSRPVRWLTDRGMNSITRMAAERLRMLCIVFMVFLLVCDTLLLFSPGDWPRASPHYSVIQPVLTGGGERRAATVKPFGQAWDRLLADSMAKKQWDSLLRLRPGLMDTLRQLKKMDSALRGN